MTNEELLDIFEELVPEIAQLNEDFPKIKELHNSTRAAMEDVRKIIDESRKTYLSDVQKEKEDFVAFSKERRQKFIDSTFSFSQSVLSGEEKVDKLQKSIDSLDLRLNSISQKITAYEKSQSKIEQKLQELTSSLSGIEKQYAMDDDDELLELEDREPIEPDFNDEGTMQFLYDKYFERLDIPLTVKKKNWYNDYCFTITGKRNSYFTGFVFRDGKFMKYDEYACNTENCALYAGPGIEAIKDFYYTHYPE